MVQGLKFWGLSTADHTYKLLTTLVNLLTVTNPIMAKEKLSYFYDTFCVLHLNIVSKLPNIYHMQS